MKIWAKTLKKHRIESQVVQEFSSARPSSAEEWMPVLAALCKPLDVAVPVLLPKHVSELRQFSRTVFRPQDFMESVVFDSFEIEIFPEKKKDARVKTFYD